MFGTWKSISDVGGFVMNMMVGYSIIGYITRNVIVLFRWIVYSTWKLFYHNVARAIINTIVFSLRLNGAI